MPATGLLEARASRAACSLSPSEGRLASWTTRRPAEPLRLAAYELRVAARFLAAQSVVQMQHSESDIPLGRKLAQRVQQT